MDGIVLDLASNDDGVVPPLGRNASAMLMAAAHKQAAASSPARSRGVVSRGGGGNGLGNVSRGRGGGGGGRSGMFSKSSAPCPFYKRIPHTPFIVDGFTHASPQLSRGSCLSHFHSDHYGGLDRQWDTGAIYCSAVTAALVVMKLKVKPVFVRALPMNAPVLVEGVWVTLVVQPLPGAVMFIFDTGTGAAGEAAVGAGGRRTYLHVGDFR